MILLIDNYDSFSYNLYQLIGEIEPEIRVIRNDEMTVNEIRGLAPDRHDPFSGTWTAGECRDHRGGGKDFRKRDSGIRGVSGASGDLPFFWSHDHLCKAADAWQTIPGTV